MKAICLISTATIMAMYGVCGEQVNPAANTNGATFREPFTLKLHVDKEHYFEQEFPKTPYVYQDEVYLFKGDAFGIDLQITIGVIRGILYQSDTNKAAVSFRFTQDVKDDGEPMMLLVIENRTKHKLFVDALMTVPAKERPQKTSILPVEPGLSSYESWPHPIVQLVLRNIRLTEKPNTNPADRADGSRPVRSGINGQPPATGSRR